jgi:acyl-CoA hydrolase
MTIHYDNYDLAVEKIIAHIGKDIFMGVPLGIGKPVGMLNAFYKKACQDPSINLTIITGLTLARPVLKNTLEKNFVEPFLNRLIGDYEDLVYEIDRVAQRLPKNVKIEEFFLAPGKYLHNNVAQQDYISSIYTRVVEDAFHNKVNVYGQQVARSKTNPNLYSLSSNSDLFDDAVAHLNEVAKQGRKVSVFAEVNMQLPFMYGEKAVFSDNTFSEIIDTGVYRSLFALPREAVSAQDHLIGLYTSSLIKDNGSLQIGIGTLSNALAYALIFRHNHNEAYQQVMHRLDIADKFSSAFSKSGSFASFTKGLYASTEMLSDEYLQLYQNRILKRRVYDHAGLQQLLNLDLITEYVTPAMIDALLEHKVIRARITPRRFRFLQKFGIFRSDITLEKDYLILPSGGKIPANFSSNENKQQIITHCLGDKLIGGKILHAGFFLGSNPLYQQLRDLSDEELRQFEMTTIQRTNTVTWSIELSSLQRQEARFVNSAMMITLSGAIVSDGLENLREVSGVGGQFDFVTMALHLKNARSIINCRATRTTKNGVESNIIWNYPNMTIPRFLRDIIITEYGIADCRSITDAEIIKEILKVTDSRFQEKLLATAKHYGKVEAEYQIPLQYKQNYPEKVNALVKELQREGYCMTYPFGSDFTEEELVIAPVLVYLSRCSTKKLIGLVIRSLFCFGSLKGVDVYLKRLKLDRVGNIREWVYRKLIIYMLHSA